tara:strand:- start:3687 stop:4160 length:474 start_codon:yes stop_codon:yes gene_type:complete
MNHQVEKFLPLPSEIIEKIKIYVSFSLPFFMKENIKIQSTHIKLKILNKKWRKIYLDLELIPLDPLESKFSSWELYLYRNLNDSEIHQFIENLSECGCCMRHSEGIWMGPPHCSRNIIGSRTFKKYFNHSKNRCSCWCRHNIRHLLRIQEITYFNKL